MLYRKESSEGNQHKNDHAIIPVKRNVQKITKVVSPQDNPVFPIRKNKFPQNAENRPSAKLNSRRNLVLHGIPLKTLLKQNL